METQRLPKKRVAMQDVADAAGVSRTTASFVLNRARNAEQIPHDTQDRVLRVARDLGYTPNRVARSLRAGKTGIIGVFVYGLSNPFFVQLLNEVERVVRLAGYDLLLGMPRDSTATGMPGHGANEGLTHDATLSGWPVDGLMALWSYDTHVLREAISNGKGNSNGPVVYVGCPTPDIDGDMASADIYSGARLAFHHLHNERGYRRIALLGPDWIAEQSARYSKDRAQVEDRVRAYYDDCAATGVRPEILVADTSDEEMRRGARDIGLALSHRAPKDRPRAVLCQNDMAAVGLISGLERGGLRVPEDVAVIGFDGTDEGQLLARPLTTISVPVRDVCEAGIDCMIARINGDNTRIEPRRVLFPCQLVVGETT